MIQDDKKALGMHMLGLVNFLLVFCCAGEAPKIHSPNSLGHSIFIPIF